MLAEFLSMTFPKFDIDWLKRTSDPGVFMRGIAYHADGAVRVVSASDEQITADVQGEETYRTEVYGYGRQIAGTCSCPYWTETDHRICKHIVAVALTANDGRVRAEKRSQTSLSSAASLRSHLEPAAKEAVRWLPKGTEAVICGMHIGGGLIYVGGGGDEELPKCVVVPAAGTAMREPDRAGMYLPANAGYSQLPPKCRLAYLQWLAGGRSDPRIAIGYVMLFFSGLERRLLKDGARNEAGDILDEVMRLQSIYRDLDFQDHCARFIEMAVLLTKGRIAERPPERLALAHRPGHGFPLGLRLGLGREASQKHRIDANWAFGWICAVGDIEVNRRAPSTDECHVDLFKIRFVERFPAGIQVPKDVRKIGDISYEASNREFTATFSGKFSVWPDVMGREDLLADAKGLYLECIRDLVEYDKMVWRHSEMKGTLATSLLLPSELMIGRPEIDEACAWLEGVGVVSVADLLSLFGLKEGKKTVAKAQAVRLSEILAKLGFGMEPDIKAGAASLSADGCVAVFRLPPSGSICLDISRKTHLCMAAMDVWRLAVADGVVTNDACNEELAEFVSRFGPTSPVERIRLEAHGRWLKRGDPIAINKALRVLRKTDEAARRELCGMATELICACGGGAPTVEMVAFLEKTYKGFGVSASDLFAILHARESVFVDEPVTVIAAGAAAPGLAIPLPMAGGEVSPGVTLDAERIERIRSDTAKASSLLAGVFVEECAAVEEPTAKAPPKHGFAGLDAKHGDLLQILSGKGSWSRDEFGAACRAIGLLSGGALETLNEWAFERFGEAIAEDETPIVINLQLLEE